MKLRPQRSLIVMARCGAGRQCAALAIMSHCTGTVASYDFGNFGRGFNIQDVQIQAFTMKPATFFLALSQRSAYVIIAKGNLTSRS